MNIKFFLEKTIKKSVLKTIKNEKMHENRFSNDLICDIKASKILCDSFCITFEETDMLGFIQKTILNPFGFLLLSYIQVRHSITLMLV